MRFHGERSLSVSVDDAWTALHDVDVLRSAIPGCAALEPAGPGAYAATLVARVGPVADTYRGTFYIDDRDTGSELQVTVTGRGRFGRLEIDLRVRLTDDPWGGVATLSYVADVVVTGFVTRIGAPALVVAGNALSLCFFRELDRAMEPALLA